LASYELQLDFARSRFGDRQVVKALFNEPIDATSLEAFLIAFSVLGVEMTEPVEGWIRRAGQQGGELGLTHLARALSAHAHQEANHHLLMLAGAEDLISRWNSRYRYQSNLQTLLEVEPTMGIQALDAYAAISRRLLEPALGGCRDMPVKAEVPNVENADEWSVVPPHADLCQLAELSALRGGSCMQTDAYPSSSRETAATSAKTRSTRIRSTSPCERRNRSSAASGFGHRPNLVGLCSRRS
jgi:hypothetical protein